MKHPSTVSPAAWRIVRLSGGSSLWSWMHQAQHGCQKRTGQNSVDRHKVCTQPQRVTCRLVALISKQTTDLLFIMTYHMCDGHLTVLTHPVNWPDLAPCGWFFSASQTEDLCLTVGSSSMTQECSGSTQVALWYLTAPT